MTTRSVDWPWVLTNLCLYLLLAHFLFIVGAGLLFPDWSLVAFTTFGLAFLAIVFFLIVIWLDYRTSYLKRANRRARMGWPPPN
jgi:hypothetical protein